MSRLFAGTPFEKPIKCDTCGKYLGEGEGTCRCIKSALPPKKKMSEQSGGKNHGPAVSKSAYQLTPQNSDPPNDQLAKIRVEKRKGNREITVISGLDHPANDLPKICTELKSHLGAGGSVQGRLIEIQGSHAAAVSEFLTNRNLKNRVF